MTARTPAPDWQAKALAATRGTRLGAILHAALGVEKPAPCFNGRATVTSDGFFMCDFTDGNGNQHMGAFGGAVADLERNLNGLAAHLHLIKPARAGLFATIRQWFDTDYRSGKEGEL